MRRELGRPGGWLALLIGLGAAGLGACAEAETGTPAQATDTGGGAVRDLPGPAPGADAGGDRGASDAVQEISPAADAGADVADGARQDGAPDVAGETGADAGGDPIFVDPCQGTAACGAAGTTCEADVLVVCARNFDDCLVEQRVDCTAAGDACVAEGPSASCRRPGGGGDGDTCADAIPLTAGIQTLSTAGFSNDYEDYDCGALDSAGGPDVVFSMSLAAGASLYVSMEDPEGDWDVVAAVADACPGLTAACLEFSDETIFLYPEEVFVMNNTGAARTYYIVADGWGGSDYGPLSVTTIVTPP